MSGPKEPKELKLPAYALLYRVWLGLLGAAGLFWLTDIFFRYIVGSSSEWASQLTETALACAFFCLLPLAAAYVAHPKYPEELPTALRGGLLVGVARLLFGALGVAFVGIGLRAVALDPGELRGLTRLEAGAWWGLVVMPMSGVLTLWFLVAGRRIRRRT
jgi:hypothetical protein